MRRLPTVHRQPAAQVGAGLFQCIAGLSRCPVLIRGHPRQAIVHQPEGRPGDTAIEQPEHAPEYEVIDQRAYAGIQGCADRSIEENPGSKIATEQPCRQMGNDPEPDRIELVSQERPLRHPDDTASDETEPGWIDGPEQEQCARSDGNPPAGTRQPVA